MISGVPSGAHSVPSCCQMRRATSSVGGALHALGERLLELAGQVGLDRGRAAGDDRLALALDARQQLRHRDHEGLDAVAQQLVGDVVEVDAGLAQRVEVALRVLGRRRAGHLAVLLRRQQRRQRHRVDRVRADQAVDVQRLRVLRVLDAGGGPQRPLDRGAGLAQLREALALEDALEGEVGGAGVGEPGAAGEVGAAERLQALVDLGVHARDEERGDRVAVERLALLVAALRRAHERLHHALVGLDREQQRDVDVEALVERLLDRRDPRVGGGDLDHHVGAVDELPVLARLLERALRVVGEPRRDLERDVAVLAARLVVDGAQHVAGGLDVAHGHAAVDLAGAQALARQRLELGVVVGRAEDRLLEDRRVGGHAAQRVLLDHALELAALDHAAAELVEPDAGPRLGERGEALVDVCDAHLETSARPTHALPVSPPPAHARRPPPR